MTKRTNKEVLAKGIKLMAGSLVCMFAGPIILHSAFKNQEHSLYIPVLIVGLLVAAGAIILAFKGMRKIMNSIF
ncbi:hypothetical protein IMCC3317_46880 [Kordia antarctica]|uniref:Uncharacterized protein n=1 Tax=Kordia antarctica TaxID=1218801 RepID=A0A7L4ZRF5_9FLAO|nr:DUF6095 family protein [Kordia antarctica]QHI39278.1 hypothetical protein IMCC3317_46880 [Kordia antarctica]